MLIQHFTEKPGLVQSSRDHEQEDCKVGQVGRLNGRKRACLDLVLACAALIPYTFKANPWDQVVNATIPAIETIERGRSSRRAAEALSLW